MAATFRILLGTWRRDAAGVTAIEYGLIAGAIATVIALGGDIANLFGRTGSALSSVGGSAL